MTNEACDFSRWVILADESATWKIAGLRQLDRVVLALSEFVAAKDSPIDVVIFWDPALSTTARCLPRHPKLNRVRPTEALGSAQPGDPVLSTRIFVERGRLGDFLSAILVTKIQGAIVDLAQSWNELTTSSREKLPGVRGDGWSYLHDPDDIANCEKEFLRRTGKAKDGIVSRHFNRRVSQWVTRRMLKFSITPNMCTMSIFALSMIGCWFLLIGNYVGFLLGTAIFQLANILDGCDGEIARSRYLESEIGSRIDRGCDFLANLIFILCLGMGLSRQPGLQLSARITYLSESVFAVVFMAARSKQYILDLFKLDQVISGEEEEIIIDTSHRVFGRGLAAFLYKLTKRDAAFLGFFLLALIGQASFVLHFYFIFVLLTWLFVLKDSARRWWRRD